MKITKLFAFGLIVSVSAWGCKTFQGASVNCSPDPLEVHADSIKYTIKASVPPKSGMKKGGVYTGEASIGGVSQGKVVFSSEKYPKVKKTGIDTTIAFNRRFESKMDGNALMIQQSYERKGKTFELPNVENLCQCCITTSQLVDEGDHLIWSKNDYKKVVPLRLEAKFNFPKNVFNIQEGDYSKSDIKAIGDFISKKYPATKITVVGFASPEGPYKRNVELSVNRSQQVQNWLTEQLKAAGYTQYLDSTFFQISYTHEDWEGFKASLETQPYTPDQKAQIREIVSAGLSEDEKEKQLMALVGGKDKVEFLLAPLRRATIVVEGQEARKTDEEIDRIAQDFANGKYTGDIKTTFQQEEWLYAVSRQNDMKVKKALLEAYRDAYPGDGRAFNDLGVIAMKEGDEGTAMNYLDKAAKMASKDYAVQNNLGAAYLRNGKYKEAKASLESSLAAQSSPEANFNLGVVLERMARYNLAVEKFNSAGSLSNAAYNAGLCKLMLGDVNGAKSSLNEAIKQDNNNAKAYYLLAVVGARASDPSVLTVNLRKACQLDGNYKQKALKDLEFRKFYTNSEFKAAVN